MLEYKFLFLGDSYTIGEGVSISDCWPNQLVKSLLEIKPINISSDIIAKTGWTTGELLQSLSVKNISDNYEMVFVLIGVNNQYRGLPIIEYHNQFSIILDKAITFSGSNSRKVFVLSIPDWGITPFAKAKNIEPAKISAQIGLYNSENRIVAKSYGVHYIDITTTTRELSYEDNYLSPDGLHPSGELYAKWVDLILPYVTKSLSIH